MRQTKTTNERLKKLIFELKKQKEPVFKRLAKELSRSARSRRQINLSRIDSNLSIGEVAVIPGKVLGTGSLSKKITIAGWKFSDEAKLKIKAAGCAAINFKELIKKKPKKMRIIG